MLKGFEKIIEERILNAQRRGEFDNLPGLGKPLELNDDISVAEDLKLAYKILKNAGFIPPEIELKKNIIETKELLSGMEDTLEKYKTMKKINFMIMKLNSMRKVSVNLEAHQEYEEKLMDRFSMEKG
ncbi:MAG: DUF1992 domain-containing protein [Desulfobacterales bacterium]|nr:DUF1992 domain-containing protein [Desulfobacterales bacterium]